MPEDFETSAIKTLEQSENALPRRQFLIGLGATALAASGGYLAYRYMTNEPTIVEPLDPAHYIHHAVTAHEQMVSAYGIHKKGQKGLYYDRYPAIRSYASNWDFAHILAATIDTAGNPALESDLTGSLIYNLSGLDQYWQDYAYRARIYSVQNEKYYDDNAWNGLNLVRAGRTLENEQIFDRARAVFAFIMSGYSKEGTCAPGGIYWKQPQGKHNPDINTVSNAPNAQLGMRLFNYTNDEQYADAAQKMYNWTKEYMRDPKDGLYWDRVKNDCSIEKTKWSYNQGTMIGAGVLLGEQNLAETTATVSLDLFLANDMHLLKHQPIEFNAIYFRNLLFLARHTTNRELSERISSSAKCYLDYVWPRFFAHSPQVLQYKSYPVIEQAAIVELIGMLGWHSSHYDLLV